MKRFGRVWLAVWLAAVMAAGAGCIDKAKLMNGGYSADDAAADGGAASSGVLIECSMTLLPPALDLADLLADTEVVASGKAAAIESVLDGGCDFALFGGGAEEAEGLETVVIGAEGVRLIVTPFYDGGRDITTDGVIDLFTGATGQQIVLGEKGLPSRTLLEEFFPLKGSVNGMQKSLIPAGATLADSDDGVAAAVLGGVNQGIFYGAVSLAYPGVTDTLALDGFTPEDAGYPAKRDVVLAYRVENADKAEALLALLAADGAAEIFEQYGVSLTY